MSKKKLDRPVNVKIDMGTHVVCATDDPVVAALPPKRRGGGSASHGKTSVFTGVRIPEDLRNQLEAYAQENNVTLSRVIVEIMQDWLAVNS